MSKISMRLFSVILFSILLVTIPRQKAGAQEVVASYQTFYDQLSPYGQWVSDAQYGDVWVPNAAPGYRPYATNGHWAMTDYGNMWVSDEPYGWATYHYGRWTYNPYYGWVWIPGHEWAPAWVSWRSGNGYYGWAPMGPGYEAGGSYAYPDDYWVFVSPEYLYNPNVYSYYDANRNYYYCQHTTYLHETYEGGGMRYNYGPRSEMIERETHQPVQVYRISNAGNPGETRVYGNTVNIYRPAVNGESRNTARPANVIRGTEPVGGQHEIMKGHENEQPAFRQEVQNHQNNMNSNSGQRYQAEPQNNARQNMNEGRQNEQPVNNSQRFNQQEHTQQNAQPQHFQQQNNQHERSQPAQQQNNRQQEPNQQQRQQGGNTQQQNNRPQQQQQRSQSQPQQQKPQSHQQSSSKEGKK